MGTKKGGDVKKLLFTLLLAGCYAQEDAAKQLRDKGRPEPIKCVTLAQAGAEMRSFACTDGEGISWVCDVDGCFKWGNK